MNMSKCHFFDVVLCFMLRYHQQRRPYNGALAQNPPDATQRYFLGHKYVLPL